MIAEQRKLISYNQSKGKVIVSGKTPEKALAFALRCCKDKLGVQEDILLLQVIFFPKLQISLLNPSHAGAYTSNRCINNPVPLKLPVCQKETFTEFLSMCRS